MVTGLKAIGFRNAGFRLFNGKTLPSDPNLVHQGETLVLLVDGERRAVKEVVREFLQKKGPGDGPEEGPLG